MPSINLQFSNIQHLEIRKTVHLNGNHSNFSKHLEFIAKLFFPMNKTHLVQTFFGAHLQVLMGSMSHSSMGLSTTTVCTLSLHCTGPCDFSKGFLFYSHLCQPTSTMLQLWGAQSCFGILVQEVSGVYFFTCCLSKVHTSLGHCTMCAILGRGGKLSPCHT